MKQALIIDDNINNVNVLSQLLRIENVSALFLHDVVDLKTQLNSLRNISVVFLDLEFRRSSGYEALATIKSHPEFKTVPVIAYTVHLAELNVASELDFDGFLGKPLDAELFPDQLARILRGEKVWFVP